MVLVLLRFGMETLETTAPTTRLYFEDAYQFVARATVLAVVQLPPDKAANVADALVLDRTIFHPQGGGQPTDVGTIKADDGRTFRVSMARAAAGVITHAGAFVDDGAAPFCAGDEVVLTIDADARRLHSRIHSAGHALDVAMAEVGQTNDAARRLVPSKGYHFPDAPSVEYKGAVDSTALPALMEQLQAALDRVVAADAPTTQCVIAATEVDPQYLGTGFPMDKPVRVVGVAGNLLCPCGGTHVQRSSELGRVVITQVKSKKGNTKVSYRVE